MQARVLVALQMLIQIQVAVDNRVANVIKYISEALLNADERAATLPNILFSAKKLTNSVITELMLLLIVVLLTFVLVKGGLYSALRDGTTSWMTSSNSGHRYLSIAGYWVVLISIAFLIPLLFFTGKLIKTMNDGLRHLGILSAMLSQKFESEWVNDLPIEKRIENSQPDPSLLFDYAGMYDQLQQLRTVPVTLRDIIGLAIVLIVPFIPILFIHFSIAELLQRIGWMLA
jgi:hypothetical protein